MTEWTGYAISSVQLTVGVYALSSH